MDAARQPPSPLDRAEAMHRVLRIWAKAIGCSTAQVTDVVTRAGLPMEKLWNSLAAASDPTGPRPTAS